MLPLERHRLIVELLGQRGVMRVNEIAQATRVSRETIRRDLSELERKGILNRSHGGALAAENPLPAIRAASPALPVEDSQEAFSRERCCTAKEKCALPAKRCSFSSRDRPSSWTAAAPAGFWPGRCRRWR
jgi:DeoR family L-fucose operon activator